MPLDAREFDHLKELIRKFKNTSRESAEWNSKRLFIRDRMYSDFSIGSIDAKQYLKLKEVFEKIESDKYSKVAAKDS